MYLPSVVSICHLLPSVRASDTLPIPPLGSWLSPRGRCPARPGATRTISGLHALDASEDHLTLRMKKER